MKEYQIYKYKEYRVYQCNPDNASELIGGLLFENDSLGLVYEYMHKVWESNPDKSFVIIQVRDYSV